MKIHNLIRLCIKTLVQFMALVATFRQEWEESGSKLREGSNSRGGGGSRIVARWVGFEKDPSIVLLLSPLPSRILPYDFCHYIYILVLSSELGLKKPLVAKSFL